MAVARFGTKALDPVLKQVRSPNGGLAKGALGVIMSMLELHTVNDAESLSRIKESLRFALSSPDWDVRVWAIMAVDHLKDREEFVPILTQIAAHDPKLTPRDPRFPNSVDFYPVRWDAHLLLEKIKNHEPPGSVRMDAPLSPDGAKSGTRANPK